MPTLLDKTKQRASKTAIFVLKIYALLLLVAFIGYTGPSPAVLGSHKVRNYKAKPFMLRNAVLASYFVMLNTKGKDFTLPKTTLLT